MDKRKRSLVTCIVQQYIQSGEPVGSLALVQRYQLGCSSATVRNELALLEETGYMYQPYTSSGRVPTDRAYELYVESVKPARIHDRQSQKIRNAWCLASVSISDRLKSLTKALATETQELAFFSLKNGESYCTGFSYLCEKPEFSDRKFASVIVKAIDRIDELARSLFGHAIDAPRVLIGRKNIFSEQGSTIFCGFRLSGYQGVFGVIGPMRMQYEKNIAILATIKSIMEQ